MHATLGHNTTCIKVAWVVGSAGACTATGIKVGEPGWWDLPELARQRASAAWAAVFEARGCARPHTCTQTYTEVVSRPSFTRTQRAPFYLPPSSPPALRSFLLLSGAKRQRYLKQLVSGSSNMSVDRTRRCGHAHLQVQQQQG